MRQITDHSRGATRRRGTVLLAAMALMVLAAALLVGTAAAASRLARIARVRTATLVADAESRRAVADYAGNWSGAADALPVGGALVTTTTAIASSGAMPVTVQLRLQRLTSERYALAVDCTVGPDSVLLARRRLRALLQRPVPIDTTAPPVTPAPISVWSVSDLH